MSAFHTAQRRGFVKGGGTVYTCRCCKRKTRPTGTGDNDNVQLCEECFNLAGEENSLSDTGKFYGTAKEIVALIEAVAANGGHPGCWSELHEEAMKRIDAGLEH